MMYGMIRRCYDNKYKLKHPTYKDCTVCDEWYNYQNFAKWYDENYYLIDNEEMNLDKDILYKGNKIYSPRTCVFVPQNINKLFTKTDKLRGEYPIGISYNKKDSIYVVHCNDGNGNLIYLGCSPNNNKLFKIYKEFKEKIIKQVADKYKNKIPQKLYDAMYKYKVEVID